MPITNEGTVEYAIPPEIKTKFTKELMSDFCKKAIDIFRKNDTKHRRDPFDYENETYYSWWVYVEGTFGFCEALELTLKEYSLHEALDHYYELPWYDSDSFNSEFGDLLVEYGLVELGETHVDPDGEEDES